MNKNPENENQSNDGTNLTRLNKFIAGSGFAARRKVDELIKEGRVTVNKKTVTELGTKIDPEKDLVKIDGEPVKSRSKFIYVLLNKPKGYITSTSDELGRPIVMDLVKLKERIYPVGRLDYDTEGLLLLTNDGELAAKLMHPKYKVFKTYLVKINKPIDDTKVNKLRTGVKVEGKSTGEAKVKIVPETGSHEILITIHEGRNRQIRKMMETVGLFVRKLKRIDYAGLKIDNLKSGHWRYLLAAEVALLKKITAKE
jgi:pseudouridine synthase